MPVPPLRTFALFELASFIVGVYKHAGSPAHAQFNFADLATLFEFICPLAKRMLCHEPIFCILSIGGELLTILRRRDFGILW